MSYDKFIFWPHYRRPYDSSRPEAIVSVTPKLPGPKATKPVLIQHRCPSCYDTHYPIRKYIKFSELPTYAQRAPLCRKCYLVKKDIDDLSRTSLANPLDWEPDNLAPVNFESPLLPVIADYDIDLEDFPLDF